MDKRQLRVKAKISELDRSRAYTIRELMDIWQVPRDTARNWARCSDVLGMHIEVRLEHNGGNTVRQSIGVGTHVYRCDMGDPGMPVCPNCQTNHRQDRRGRTPHLKGDCFDFDENGKRYLLDEPVVYCPACGYDPQGKKLDELQVKLARIYHHAQRRQGGAYVGV